MSNSVSTLELDSVDTSHGLKIKGNAFDLSPLRIMFAVGLSYIAFIMLRYVPSIPAFWRVFYHKWMLNFVKGFFCIYWDNHMVFIFQFANVVYYIDLWILKNPCITRIKPTWSWCMIFLICCWILLVRILLRIFASISSVILACSFLFLWHCCLVLELG